MKTKRILICILSIVLLCTTVVIDATPSEANAAIAMATVYITLNEGVASISVNLGTTYTESGAITYTSSTTYKAGNKTSLAWKATPKSGYVLQQETGTITVTTNGYNEIAPIATLIQATPKHTLTVTLNTGVKSISVTYGSNSKTFTSNGTLSIEEGTRISWTATAAIGYNLSVSSSSFTMTAARTIAPTASVKSYTVRVTSYTPSDAVANFSWKLEWASGKALSGAVTDYVTMTVASDGKSVTLTFKKAFTGGEMLLTCYATNNPGVKATCTVTCS